jgi:hypothetical protein
MARQSKSDFAARKAQNKGVAHGTTKKGAGKAGVMRRWNENTARWEVASKPATPAPKRKVAGRGPSLGARARAAKAATRYTSTSVMQAPKTSWGSARSSMSVGKWGMPKNLNMRIQGGKWGVPPVDPPKVNAANYGSKSYFKPSLRFK